MIFCSASTLPMASRRGHSEWFPRPGLALLIQAGRPAFVLSRSVAVLAFRPLNAPIKFSAFYAAFLQSRRSRRLRRRAEGSARRRFTWPRTDDSRGAASRFPSRSPKLGFRCWSTAIAIWIFPISPRSSTRWSRAPSAAGVATMVTICTRVRTFDQREGDRRALRQRLLLGRNASAQRA